MAGEERPSPEIDFDTFMAWSQKAFEDAASMKKVFPFESVFGMQKHFVGEDDLFTTKVNEAIPLYAPRVQKEGIRIPYGDVAVISCVRRPGNRQDNLPVDSGAAGVWTLDRVREIPSDHELVKSIWEWSPGSRGNLERDVRQWFVIARFQATPTIRPPLLVLVFGFCEMKDDGTIGGVCPLAPSVGKAFGVDSVEKFQKMVYSFTYECCECLRQIAAISYLESK